MVQFEGGEGCAPVDVDKSTRFARGRSSAEISSPLGPPPTTRIEASLRGMGMLFGLRYVWEWDARG